jgi:hypothetical protein
MHGRDFSNADLRWHKLCLKWRQEDTRSFERELKRVAMEGQSVLLRIESVLAVKAANFKDRTSNSGFNSVIFQVVNHVPVMGPTAAAMGGHWFRRKVL